MEFILKIYDVNSQCSSRQVSLPCIIGRSRDATVPIFNALISRKHCEISIDNGNLYIKDVGSLNGTFLHGMRINSKTPLSWGKIFYIGDYSFQCEMLPEYKSRIESDNINPNEMTNDVTQDENVQVPILLRPTKIELEEDNPSPEVDLDSFSKGLPFVVQGEKSNNKKIDLEKNSELDESSSSDRSCLLVNLDPIELVPTMEGFNDGDSQSNDYSSSSSSHEINLMEDEDDKKHRDNANQKKIDPFFGQPLE